MRSSLFLLLFFILIPLSFAQEETLYADIVIELHENGAVDISGETNYEPFEDIHSSQQFTSKEGEVWTLNLTTQEEFGYYVFELRMPENAQITYLKAPSKTSILGDEKISILGEAGDKPFELLVQYRINQPIEGILSLLYIKIPAIFIFLGAITVFIVFIKRKKIRKNIESESKTPEDPIMDLSIYPQRQKDIMEILHKVQKISQKELEDKLAIPKSSVSRNLRSLEMRGLIRKERMGVTNYIFLEKKQ